MSYESKRFKGPCLKCDKQSYRKHLCIEHYKEDAKLQFHCTVHKCHRPIFATTLCRTHFKSFNTWCRIDNCGKHPVANGMCNYHYRRIQLEPLICVKCDKKQFMNSFCFKHYLEEMPGLRKCIIQDCNSMRDVRGMCRKHYMAWRRSNQLEVEAWGGVESDANA